MQNCQRVVLLIFIVSTFSGIALAQRATLTGTVVDQQGAVVPNVAITVLNVGQGLKREATTDERGYFAIPLLQPGRYTVMAQREGFFAAEIPNVVLHVGDAKDLTIELQVGAVAQTITVEGGAPLINTQSPAVSTVIDRNFAESLPLNGRSFNTLLQLTPGVVLTPASDGGSFSINGQRTNANYFTVDGVSANFGITARGVQIQAGGGGTPAFNVYGGTSGLVSVDALEEFRIQTSTFAPEYGRTPGGQVSLSTRSGTNEFHGGLFNYFRNDKLDATDWFANAAEVPKAPNRQNDFGGFLGGPIVPDKTFFFFSYEGLRLRLPQTRTLPVPSLALRAAAIPAAAPYLNAFPEPNGPDLSSVTAQFTGSYSDPTELNATSVRIDHTLNSKVTLFGRYNYAPSFKEERGGTTGAPSWVAFNEIDTQTLTLGATLQLTPRVTNSFRASYSVQEGNGGGRGDPFGGATLPDPSLMLPPPLSATRTFALFEPFESRDYTFGRFAENRERQINLVDDLAVTVGAHQLKFGVDYGDLLFSKAGSQLDLLYFVFSLQNFAATAISEFIFADVLQPTKIRFRSFSLYGQDAWRIGQRLTLTYGLRWEFNPAPKGRDGTPLLAWTNVDDPPNTALAPVGTPLWKNRYDNFAPRVGIAYQLTSKGDLVVRGGWGLFYDLGRGIVPRLPTLFPNETRVFASGLLPMTDLTAVTPPPASLQPPYPNVFGFSPDLRLPRSQQWNVAVEKSLGGEQALSVTYVGQVGRKLLRQEVEVQPNPDFSGRFNITRNGDTSDYHALQAQFRRRLSRGLQALVNYTWSHSIDTSSDDSIALASGTVISRQSNRGSSSFDVRHNFSAAVTYELPSVTNQGPLAHLTKGWSLDAVVQARSALPFDVITTAVAIPGVSGVTTRVDLVQGEPFWLQDGSVGGGRRLNPAAFALPPTPRQGTLGRNVIRGFDLAQVDLSIGRRFSLTEKVNLQFRADMFNLFNHANFADPREPRISGSGLTNDRSSQMLNQGLGGSSRLGLSPLFQLGGPRSMQLSLKLTF